MARSWTAEDLLGLARSYQAACVLDAAVDLGLFEALGDGGIDAAEAARRAHSDLRATVILLDALAALELIDKTDGRYSVPSALRPLFGAGGESVLAMVQHQSNCLRRWARLGETARQGIPPERTPSVRGETADRESFIEAMDVVNRNLAGPLVEELSHLPFTRLLDVGGASGTWTIAWLRANPRASAILFDLPEVIPLAARRLRAAKLDDRVTLVPGDFSCERLPAGADLAWLSAIVHQNSREENRELFAKVHAALVAGGRVLIRDIVMEPSHTRPVAGALFAVNMLAATRGGGTYSLAELGEDLEHAGFLEVEQLRRDDGMCAVVSARRNPSALPR